MRDLKIDAESVPLVDVLTSILVLMDSAFYLEVPFLANIIQKSDHRS